MTETNETDFVPDDFYRAFEERFRGSQELISERLKAYVPFLRALRAQADSPRGLDLGCGRGEWLQLLESEGFEACGVDLNDGMLQSARENGLRVENMDAIAALVETGDGSLDVVSGFHIMEHLSFPKRLALIREACRTLRPGGLLILETPNPENIHVGTCSFHLDPTHIAPIPPMLMPFLAEYAGFAQSVILRLNTPPPGGEPTLLDVYTKVAGDYALVARIGGAENSQMDQAFNTNVGLDIFSALARYDALLREQITREVAVLNSQLKSLSEEMERMKPRSLWQKLFFWRSGRS
ncbi:MAG: methyltransferase domain-containing protein [Rhizobiaceae bacterium]